MVEKIALIGIVSVLWSACNIIALKCVMWRLNDILERISSLDSRIYKLDWDLGKTEIMIKMIKEKLAEDSDGEEE